MRVMCIQSGKWLDVYKKEWPGPSFGDIDTVIEEGQDEFHKYYCLDRFGDEARFGRIFFVPAPDTDEALIKEYEETTIEEAMPV
jgi:hypothetical protein